MKRERTTLIVVHCSATRPSQDIGAEEIREWHLAKGYRDIGYHFVIRRNGAIEIGRPIDGFGAHVTGFNATSVAICLVGGLLADGKPADVLNPLAFDTFTVPQMTAAHTAIAFLRRVYPHAKVVGHRDLSPDMDKDGAVEKSEWLKTCPGFDVGREFPP